MMSDGGYGCSSTAVGTAALGVASHPAAVAEDPDEFTVWFEDVENFDGIVDRRGESPVTITVGAPGNGGDFAFKPAAVRVDPGTTVVWEWTGRVTSTASPRPTGTSTQT